MEPKTTPRYSIIIPAYNEADELPVTLASIREAMSEQAFSGELIVTDNNSTDDTTAVAKANGADQVVFEPINQIARARNAGAAVATGTYLVFVDADTRIPSDLLRKALGLLEEGYAGGGALIEFEGEVSGVGRFALGLWERTSKFWQLGAGSFLFCRRDAFEAIGGFDNRLYAGEEIRFSSLIKKWGRREGRRFRVIETPAAQTSARKLEWYSGAEVLGWMAFLMVFPVAVRWRGLCSFWYRRPNTDSP